ncbi:hypothetical protein A2U01_0100671, partial [Trifolium medium]|nr:hypothetical protein [Trifolium medium]
HSPCYPDLRQQQFTPSTIAADAYAVSGPLH